MDQSNDSDGPMGCGDDSVLDRTEVRIVLIVLYVAVWLLCLLGNSFTIIVICVHRSMRTSTNFFLGNLAVADLLVSVFCILQNMFHVVGTGNGNWPLGEVPCKLYVLVLHVVPCTGIGILVCVSLEKYIAVLHPLLALKLLTPKLRALMTASIWALSIIFNLPYYFTTKHRTFAQYSSCGRDISEFSISFVIWYCVPLLTIIYIYSRVGVVLWRSSMKPLVIRATVSPSTTDALASLSDLQNDAVAPTEMENLAMGEHQRAGDEYSSGVVANGTDVVESRKKIIRLLIAIVSSFAVLTFPHHARLLHLAWSTGHSCNERWTALFQPSTYILLFLSSSVNPILYAFMSQRFRAAVRDIMHCRSRGQTRKYTRTRTIVSECPEQLPSRSPSLSRNNNVRTTTV